MMSSKSMGWRKGGNKQELVVIAFMILPKKMSNLIAPDISRGKFNTTLQSKELHKFLWPMILNSLFTNFLTGKGSSYLTISQVKVRL